MAKSETTTEDYEDHRIHLAKQPYDVLIAWAVVCCLALGVIVGYWGSIPLRLGAELPADDGANLSSPAPASVHGEKATLADEIGMISKPMR